MKRLALLSILLLAPQLALAQSLVVDLSSNLVAISTGFTGAEVVLFGATNGEGDVAIVVRGPDSRVTVRQKRPVAGIWLNWRSVDFVDVPGYYGVATSRALAEIAPEPVRQRFQLGLEAIALEPGPESADAFSPEELAQFREALIRNKQRAGLYPTGVAEAAVMGNRLFRATVSFPANVPTGLYNVDTYLLRDGQVVDAQNNTLVVSKVGFSAQLFRFANRDSVLYALLAVIGALASGWIAALLFRSN